MQQMKQSRNTDSKRPSSYKKHSGGKAKSPYLSTDVTTLDVNTAFVQNQQQKKMNSMAAKSRQSAAQHSVPTNLYHQQKSYQPQNNFISSSSFYSGFDQCFNDLISSDLPSLMSVSPYKQGVNESFDMKKFTEELIAVNNGLGVRMSGGGEITHLSDYSPMSKIFVPNGFSRNSATARKNRMVEVKTIDDRPVVVISDPMAASANNRSTVMQLAGAKPVGVSRNMEIPYRVSESALFSRKVFIGGLPIDVTEEEVWTTFGAFGKVLVDWPRRPENGRGDCCDMEVPSRRNSRSVSGYVFLVFQNERSVQELVNSCEIFDDKYYIELSSPTMCDKAVQVRAWRLSDIDYFVDHKLPIDHRRTVFIGGVPRPTKASTLAKSLENLYGKVSYVGIDIDPELKYPKGAARVTFATAKSFVAAISGRFVQVINSEYNKRVEIKPYVMEDQICDECEGKLCNFNYAQYFCGDPSCLQYYCEVCWDRMHYDMSNSRSTHQPMVRTGDQTKLLKYLPHHLTNSTYDRNMNHCSSDHSSTSPSRTLSQPSNRSHYPTSKQFSAIPTTIGY